MAQDGRPLGEMLDRFAAFQHMSPATLAGFLGLELDRLPLLFAYTLPEERAEGFAAAVADISRETGASAARVMQVARIAKILR